MGEPVYYREEGIASSYHGGRKYLDGVSSLWCNVMGIESKTTR
jgi:adenosylmethionine-8-amino-7-oxononanoate aminotransferase